VLRAAETAALGAAVACAAALLLMPVLVWRGEDPLGPAAILLLLGLASGAAWGLARRPRVLDAAMQADRQLLLCDLLGTAWALSRQPQHPANPFCAAVLATAEARCAVLSPAQVVLSRLGARRWSGIGLLAALVLSVGWMYRTPSPTSAQAFAGSAATTAQRQAHPRLLAANVSRPDLRRPPTQFLPDEHRGIGLGQPPARNSAAAATTGDAGSGSADPHGAGGGAGRTGVSSLDSSLPIPKAGAAAAGDAPGASGAGLGAASAADAAGQASDALAVSPSPSRAAPPWRSDLWPEARRRAADALQRGAVPEACRDLVRDYFQRD